MGNNKKNHGASRYDQTSPGNSNDKAGNNASSKDTKEDETDCFEESPEHKKPGGLFSTPREGKYPFLRELEMLPIPRIDSGPYTGRYARKGYSEDYGATLVSREGRRQHMNIRANSTEYNNDIISINSEEIDDETNSKRNPQPKRSAGIDNLNKAKKLKEWLFFYIGKLLSIGRFDRTPERSAILRAHYSWTSQLFLLMFSYCASSWYGEVPIKCFEMFDLQRAAPEVEDVCVQFPYTMNKTQPHIGGEKYYAQYYMWVHWICLLFFLVFQIVRGGIFFFEHREFRKFVIELENTFDYFVRLKKTKEYYQKNFGIHSGMVFRCIMFNLGALFVNLCVAFGIDSLLGRKYFFMPWFLTVTRDCVFFDDPFSILFPPFAYCDITPTLHIQVGRHQLYGCQLPLNETYAKFFMGLWFWQAILVIWSICSVFYWCSIYCSKSSSKQLLDDGSYKKFPDVKSAVKKLTMDEALALSIIKPCLYAPHYRALVQSIAMWDPCQNDLKIIFNYDNPNFPDILENITIAEENEREQDTIENFFTSPVLEPSNVITSKLDGDDNEESESSDDPPKKDSKNDSDSKSSNKGSKKVPAKTPPVINSTAQKPRHPEGWNFPLKAFLAVNPTGRPRQMIPLPSLKHNIARYKENSISDPYLSVAESPEPHEILNSGCSSSIDLVPGTTNGSKNKKDHGIQKSNSSAQDRKSQDKKNNDQNEKKSTWDKKNSSADTRPSAPEVEPEENAPHDYFNGDDPKEEPAQDCNQVGGGKKRNKKKK